MLYALVYALVYVITICSSRTNKISQGLDTCPLLLISFLNNAPHSYQVLGEISIAFCDVGWQGFYVNFMEDSLNLWFTYNHPANEWVNGSVTPTLLQGGSPQPNVRFCSWRFQDVSGERLPPSFLQIHFSLRQLTLCMVFWGMVVSHKMSNFLFFTCSMAHIIIQYRDFLSASKRIVMLRLSSS